MPERSYLLLVFITPVNKDYQIHVGQENLRLSANTLSYLLNVRYSIYGTVSHYGEEEVILTVSNGSVGTVIL